MSELMVEAYEFLIKSLKEENQEHNDTYFENLDKEYFNIKFLIKYVSEEIGYQAALKMCKAADEAYKQNFKTIYGFVDTLEFLNEENNDE